MTFFSERRHKKKAKKQRRGQSKKIIKVPKQQQQRSDSEIRTLPASSGFVEEQSASFPGRDDDLKTLFCRTNSLALFAASAA